MGRRGAAAGAGAGLLGGGAAPERQSGSRLHLLTSVSSDEVRYVNPFAAGKWRAGSGPRHFGAGDTAQGAEAGGGAEPQRRAGGGGLRGPRQAAFPRRLPPLPSRPPSASGCRLPEPGAGRPASRRPVILQNLVQVGKVFPEKPCCQ